MTVITYSVAEVVDQIGAPSERWVIQKLRSGRFPGRKVGRNWRLTEQDVTDALDACRINRTCVVETPQTPPVTGLTPTSRRKYARSAEGDEAPNRQRGP